MKVGNFESPVGCLDSTSKRPWSVKPTNFVGGKGLDFKKIVSWLGYDPSSLCIDNVTGEVIDNEWSDKIWKEFNSRYNLPFGFLQKYSSVDLV